MSLFFNTRVVDEIEEKDVGTFRYAYQGQQLVQSTKDWNYQNF